MASAAARRLYQDQIPPHMSIFDLEAEIMTDGDTVTLVDPTMIDMDAKVPHLAVSSQPTSLHPTTLLPDSTQTHHNHTSTLMSGSTDSSPTTTLSTTDSSPLSDPSPSSSPDSPVNLIPLSDYPCASFASRPSTTHGSSMLGIPEPRTFARPMTSPVPRKPRNMKGLSIQPPLAITTTPKHAATEPSSPSFIKPTIPAMKRKPSQLSLKTDASDLMKKTSLEVPASPAMPPIHQRRALKHSNSSPHMFAAMKTCTFGPPRGMTFPKVLERNESGLSEVLRPTKSRPAMALAESIAEEDSPIKTQMASRNEMEPFHESVNNEDQKSPGYPDGPVAIYGDNVYLYLEPTADEASQFDVVINVAREVRNPFEGRGSETANPACRRAESPISDTAATAASFATALDLKQPEDVSLLDTPTTPKASPCPAPEYIHVPWDHSTDIAPDLMELCEIIENRTENGQKVLVHCQQGASRSASLIIAYGLYRSPESSVNDAYYAAQAKSRWISPNMKLMYSLQDFQKDLSKKRQPLSSSAYRPRTGRSPTKHRLTLSADAIGVASNEPNTAPLPGEKEASYAVGANSPTRARKRPSMSGLQAISPGPASAPLSYSWRDRSSEADSASPDSPSVPVPPSLPLPSSSPPTTKTTELPQPSPLSFPAAVPNLTRPEDVQKRPKTGPCKAKAGLGGHGQKWLSLGLRGIDTPAAFSSFPLRKFQSMAPAEPQDKSGLERTIAVGSCYADKSALLSPRAETMTTNPLHQVPEVAGMRFVESCPTPTEGLFSPRETTFPQDSCSFFGRMMGFSRPPQFADPRSPPKKGEAPITRSIDEFI
ncbi:hypothetical protein E4U41_000771 [Claviceps citrina]|nr:hypothetical protein E4U41_000771 [Claviceps citrina]